MEKVVTRISESTDRIAIWEEKQQYIKPGGVVLIKGDNKKCGKWNMGIVRKFFQGN